MKAVQGRKQDDGYDILFRPLSSQAGIFFSFGFAGSADGSAAVEEAATAGS